jgi:hypothetical protein
MALPGAGDVFVQYPGGNTYVGQFRAGTETRHGRGVMKYTNGDD